MDATLTHIDPASTALPSLPPAAGRSDIRRVAEEFESVFIAQMLQPMFAGVETDPMFGGGPSEDVYRSLMVAEYGKLITSRGGIGIAAQVEAELIRMQEAADA
jgi:Rod binding domain-containing protein